MFRRSWLRFRPWMLGFALAVTAHFAFVADAQIHAAGPDATAPLSPSEIRVLQRICATCHARPGIGVPVMGDEAAWAPRRAKGVDLLLANTVNGFGGMPPLGTCSWCSEDELRRLVAVISGAPAR
jgi:cytochrome c5